MLNLLLQASSDGTDTYAPGASDFDPPRERYSVLAIRLETELFFEDKKTRGIIVPFVAAAMDIADGPPYPRSSSRILPGIYIPLAVIAHSRGGL